jgi:hypothetical protein
MFEMNKKDASMSSWLFSSISCVKLFSHFWGTRQFFSQK